MKVKDLIKILSGFNPEAEVRMLIKERSWEILGSEEGLTGDGLFLRVEMSDVISGYRKKCPTCGYANTYDRGVCKACRSGL